ncbi:MAG: polysaccharide biosynthesis/export family protein [Syntrophobacteraceae bacterium]|nr:polysaccharide biosynthesis/export family protein [Syntrophobacteraceae bacterium]
MHRSRFRGHSGKGRGKTAWRIILGAMLMVGMAHLAGCSTTTGRRAAEGSEPRAPFVDAASASPLEGGAGAVTAQDSGTVSQDPHGVPLEPPYRLRSGDSFAVRFLHNPELSGEVTVRPDGKVTLPLVGDVPVEGYTIPEVHAAVSEDYKAFIRDTSYGDLLKEGDYLELRFVYNPELNIGVRVRSDGKISLPLLGDVQAAGLRPDALRQSLISRYSSHIRKPDVALLVGETTAKKVFADPELITVALLKHASHEIFVGGEVQAPKVVTFEGRITTLQAIMKAGGVKDTGDLGKVVVLRRGQFERPEWIQLNLSKPLSGESIHNDLPLRNGDVVVVPMTGIAKVDLFVRQYIREVLPIQSFFNVTVIPLDAGGL